MLIVTPLAAMSDLADLYHLLAGETAVGRKLRDSFEVTVLPTRQAPAQHASRDEADALGQTGHDREVGIEHRSYPLAVEAEHLPTGVRGLESDPVRVAPAD